MANPTIKVIRIMITNVLNIHITPPGYEVWYFIKANISYICCQSKIYVDGEEDFASKKAEPLRGLCLVREIER
jgi:hypothetical protein